MLFANINAMHLKQYDIGMMLDLEASRRKEHGKT